MAGTIVLRLLQILCLVGIVVGSQQIAPLSSEIRNAWDGEGWTTAGLCGRLAAVTGPIVVALVLIGLLELVIRHNSEQRQLRSAHPHEPWLWNHQWAARHMRLSNKPLVIAWLCFMAIYLFAGLPLAIASQNRPIMIFAAVFGLIGLITLRMLWLSRRWNRAELRIATLPGVIGGPFSGVVILKQVFPPETIFDVNLKCVLSHTRRHRKKSETTRIDKWSSTIHIQKPIQGGPKGTTALPVSFAIPFDAMASGTRGDDTVRWTLSVQKQEEVSTGGAAFEIPVYRTPDSCQNYELDDKLIANHLAVIDPTAVLKRFGYREQQLSPDGLRLHFREFDVGIFATLIVMSLMLIAGLVAMWYWITNANTRLFAMAFPVIFLLMFLYGIVHMLFWRCRIDKTPAEGSGPTSWPNSRPAASPRIRFGRVGHIGFSQVDPHTL